MKKIIAKARSNPAMAQIKGCQVFNFKELFIADYSTGSTWRDGSVDLEITWSASMDHIYDEAITRPFTQRELGNYMVSQTAFTSLHLNPRTPVTQRLPPPERGGNQCAEQPARAT